MIHRRHLLACSALLAAVPFARAQTAAFPAKTVRIIVPFGVGGETDIVARRVASKLTETRGYNAIVENRAGGVGNIGVEYALREPPDGYTLLAITGSYTTNAIANKPNFDPVNGIKTVIQLTRTPSVLMVNADSPYRTLKDIVDAAKREPGRLTYGTSGRGSLGHFGGEYLAALLGVKFNDIPYKGSNAAMTDLMGGQITMMTVGLGSSRSYLQSGRVRPIAVTGTARHPDLPNVPTFAESGVNGFDTDIWHGLIASKDVPAPIIAKLNADINEVLKQPAFRSGGDGAVPVGGTPEQFGKKITGEIQRWRQIAESLNLKFD